MHSSGEFHSGARKLKNKLWWKNTKLWIIVIIIIIIILLIIGKIAWVGWFLTLMIRVGVDDI